MKKSVGFIGLGIMGRGMALNLVRAGFDVHVWNRTPGKAGPVAEAGATVHLRPRDVVAAAATTVLCLGDTSDVEEVLFGGNGIALEDIKGKRIVDCSTISPNATKEIARRLEEREASFLDAPVSGGSEGAEKGTLSIMVGGRATDLEAVKPILAAMGSSITHVGEHGAGQLVKLVNQILVAGSMLAMGEALLFAQAGGLDLAKTLAAVKDGAAGSWTLSNRGPQVIDRDWRPGFTIDLQQKDLRLVRETADSLGVPTFATDVTASLYRTLQKAGMGGLGNHALIKALENLASSRS